MQNPRFRLFTTRRITSTPIAALACVASLLTSPAGAQPGNALTIAAASDLQHVMPLLTARFREMRGQAVRVVYGSSGNFVAQIQSGAPFDLFFSADVEYARRLEADGLAERGSLFPYATGRLVIWSRKDRPLDRARGLEALLDPAVRHIAIANPAHAPYGRAAVAALEHAQLYDRVRAKLVLGENVSQAAQFVESGNADAGIIALALALSPALAASGAYVEVPTDFYPSMVQAAVVVAASPRRAAAHDFLAFLRSADARRLLQTFGFSPAADAASRR